MQKSTKTKEIPRMQRRIFFGAIMLALLVHGILLVLFEYAPSEKTYSSTHTAGVTFMNLASQTPARRREILNWLEYHEPSLISVPNAKYGYNQLTANVDFRPAQPDKVHRADLPEVPKKKPKEFSSLKMHNKAENILLRNLIFKHPHKIMSEAPRPAVPDIKYPLIKNGNTVLELSFSSYLLKDSEKLKAKPMLINYNLTRSKMLPRVEIVNSSGSYDFDMLVLRELSLHIDELAKGGKNFTISIQWRREAE